MDQLEIKYWKKKIYFSHKGAKVFYNLWGAGHLMLGGGVIFR